jgi:hypothetical protein
MPGMDRNFCERCLQMDLPAGIETFSDAFRLVKQCKTFRINSIDFSPNCEASLGFNQPGVLAEIKYQVCRNGDCLRDKLLIFKEMVQSESSLQGAVDENQLMHDGLRFGVSLSALTEWSFCE